MVSACAWSILVAYPWHCPSVRQAEMLSCSPPSSPHLPPFRLQGGVTVEKQLLHRQPEGGGVLGRPYRVWKPFSWAARVVQGRAVCQRYSGQARSCRSLRLRIGGGEWVLSVFGSGRDWFYIIFVLSLILQGKLKKVYLSQRELSFRWTFLWYSCQFRRIKRPT